MKIYLDLDRTLCDTARVAPVIWRELERLYGERAARGDAEQTDYYVTVPPDSYYYDMQSQLVAYGIDPHEAAERLTASRVADNRLLIDGAEALVERLRAAGHELAILSFGQVYYQELKVALCPALAGTPMYVTLEPKGRFLADKGECVMVDDKNIAPELPANVHFIWVQIEGEAKSVPHADAYTSLAAVGDALEVLPTP